MRWGQLICDSSGQCGLFKENVQMDNHVHALTHTHTHTHTLTHSLTHTHTHTHTHSLTHSHSHTHTHTHTHTLIRESLMPVGGSPDSEPEYKNVLGRGLSASGEEGKVKSGGVRGGRGRGGGGRGVVEGHEEALYTDHSNGHEQVCYY